MTYEWRNTPDAPLKLKGFNRHDAHPDYGAALPYEVIVSDVRWMVAAGANFVRGSHYPQDARLLDAADALGLLVWEEIIGWGVPVESLGSSRWLDRSEIGKLDRIPQCSKPHIFVGEADGWAGWGFGNYAMRHMR